MFHRDFLLRQIHQFVQGLAQVLFFKRTKRYDEALREIELSGRTHLGLDLSDVITVTYDDVVKALKARDHDDAQYATLAAELLRQQGEILAVQARIDASDHCFQLALHLYLDCFERDERTRSPDTVDRIDALMRQADLDLTPVPALRLLARYLERVGRYGKAEDVLFFLAGIVGDELREDGEAFFQRLLLKTDDQLAAGGLPRQEVEEGMVAFGRKISA